MAKRVVTSRCAENETEKRNWIKKMKMSDPQMGHFLAVPCGFPPWTSKGNLSRMYVT